MNENEGETRREFLSRCGKVGLAGLSTILFLELVGTKKIIRKFSQKDPNAFWAGVDFEAYDWSTKISIPGKKDIKVVHWVEKFNPQVGSYMAPNHRSENEPFPYGVLTWAKDMSCNVLSFRPYYGEVVEGFVNYLIAKESESEEEYRTRIRNYIENKGETAVKILSDAGKDRNLIFRFSSNPKDYSFLEQYEENSLNYVLKKTASQCSDFDNVMLELVASDKSELSEHKKRIKLLRRVNRESFGKRYGININLEERHAYNQGKKLWDPEKSRMYWDYKGVGVVTITDVSSSIEQLDKSIETFKKAIYPKRLFVRIVTGQDRVKAGFKGGVLDLEKRVLAIKNSSANAVLVNDVDGSWLFSGKGNPFDYKKRERMLTKTYKEFFGTCSNDDCKKVDIGDEYSMDLED